MFGKMGCLLKFVLILAVGAVIVYIFKDGWVA